MKRRHAAGRHFGNSMRRILYVRGCFEKSVEDQSGAVEASAERAVSLLPAFGLLPKIT